MSDFAHLADIASVLGELRLKRKREKRKLDAEKRMLLDHIKRDIHNEEEDRAEERLRYIIRKQNKPDERVELLEGLFGKLLDESVELKKLGGS